MANSSSSMSVSPNLTTQIVDEVTREVFMTMFGLEATRVEQADAKDLMTPSAFVGIQGSWQGTVWVRARRPLLIQLVTMVAEIEDHEVDVESMADTLGELANMIGGAFKARLGGACQLSLPTLILNEQGPSPEDDAPLDYMVEGNLVQVFLNGAAPSSQAA